MVKNANRKTENDEVKFTFFADRWENDVLVKSVDERKYFTRLLN